MCAVLFVSSDTEARRRWCEALDADGHHVVALAPGLEALLVATTPFDAIVADIDFAADWQYFRALGQEKHHLTAPLIVMSAWSAPDGPRRLAFSMGCDAFVAKPCSVETLLDVIDRLAAGEGQILITATG
jgi:CheY-like chemotaxis protein